jgi:hypothetical protein
MFAEPAPLKVPADIVAEIRRRRHKAGYTSPDVSEGGDDYVCGSIGYSCCISKDGDCYMALDPFFQPGRADGPPIIDRSRRAQLQVLVLAGEIYPQLLSLLPPRPPAASDCKQCHGGWIKDPAPLGKIICQACHGMGWIEESG